MTSQYNMEAGILENENNKKKNPRSFWTPENQNKQKNSIQNPGDLSEQPKTQNNK